MNVIDNVVDIKFIPHGLFVDRSLGIGGPQDKPLGDYQGVYTLCPVKKLIQREISVVNGGHGPEEMLFYGCGLVLVIGIAIGWCGAAFYYAVSRDDKKIEILGACG